LVAEKKPKKSAKKTPKKSAKASQDQGRLDLSNPEGFAAEIVEIPVADEMSESFLAYSLSVITARAIPDIRDGLKPVQRRILYSMLNMGVRPDTPHRKSARVVGDTMGKYHPHGDSAIYDAMVRLGQDFSRNLTLVDPQGNFGSLDDGPAAARYTECRLTPAAMAMLAGLADGHRELDEDTVNFRGTYDGEGTEPEYLPAIIPNLLVNGTTGIAVGMATNMAPHNLTEVAEAIRIVLNQRRPKPTVEQLMEAVPGPDFPSGGIIIDEGIRDAYETGRGTIKVRARVEIEQLTAKRQGIIITELPYMVGPEKVVSKIMELVNNGKVEGISDVKNLSDRHQGMRIMVECRVGVNPQAVLADLYRYTPMEETFGINNVVLIDGTPTTVSLFELCHHYIAHRLEVIVRRTEYRLQKDRDRLHIVDGLLIALDNIDLVIRILRGSQTVQEGRDELMAQLDLSEIQATHILDMQFRRLVAMEKQKYIDERQELLGRIEDYEKLLASERRQRKLVETELDEAVELFGVTRRSQIISPDDIEVYEAPPENLVPEDIPDEPVVVTLSSTGHIGRAPAEGASRATPGRHDVIVSSVNVSTAAHVVAVTSEGRALKVLAWELGEVAGRSRGSSAAQVFGTNKGEDILTLVTAGDDAVILVTAKGVAKQLSQDEVAETVSGRTVIKLRDGDTLAAAYTSPEGADVVMVASDGQVLRTPIDGISLQGRGASGVGGMKLRGDARVLTAGPATADACVVTVSDIGTAKATSVSEIPEKGRNGQGLRSTRFGKESRLVLAHVGPLASLLTTMSTDDDQTKADPTPVAFPLEPTPRDLVSVATDRTILDLGPARW